MGGSEKSRRRMQGMGLKAAARLMETKGLKSGLYKTAAAQLGLGGLHAAYLTDLIQGICIIVLSVLLVPFGAQALLDRFGTPEMEQSFRQAMVLLHERLPAEYFQVVGSSTSSER